MTRRLVFVDTETTGLAAHHVPWEVAWAIDDGPVKVEFLPLSVQEIAAGDPVGMNIGRFYDRYPNDLRAHWTVLDIGSKRAELAGDLNGATLVACNPAFDARMLVKFLGCEPWHYRLLDVEAYAMGALGLDHVPGLKEIRDILADRGCYDLPEPDHTAESDVLAMRAAFRQLELVDRRG